MLAVSAKSKDEVSDMERATQEKIDAIFARYDEASFKPKGLGRGYKRLIRLIDNAESQAPHIFTPGLLKSVDMAFYAVPAEQKNNKQFIMMLLAKCNKSTSLKTLVETFPDLCFYILQTRLQN